MISIGKLNVFRQLDVDIENMMNEDSRSGVIPLILVVMIAFIVSGCSRFSPEIVVASPTTLEPSYIPGKSTAQPQPSPTNKATPVRSVIEPSNAIKLSAKGEMQFIGSTGFTWVNRTEEIVGGIALSQEQQVQIFSTDSPADADVIPDDFPSKLTASSGSSTIAWKNANEAIRIWDLGEVKELLMIQGDQSAITSLALSSDGDLLALSTADNILRIWNISEAETTLDIMDSGWYSGLDFSPDNRQLAAVDPQNSTVTVFDVSTGEEFRIYSWTDHASPVLYGAYFSPKWEQLAWVARGSIQVMDAGTGAFGPMLSHEDFVSATAWSPDGSLLASAAGGTIHGKFLPLVHLWNPKTGKIINKLVMSEPVSSISFSPDGLELAILLSDGQLQIWAIE